MEKSIKILVKKLHQNEGGGLSGGFMTIKGGFKVFESVTTLRSVNSNCTNVTSCAEGTNNCGGNLHTCG